jgi:hypothetical protein
MKNTTKLILLIVLSIYATTTFTQTKKNTITGTLTGKVDIGPLCPVEPCTVPPERLKAVFAAHRVIIYDSNKKLLMKLSISKDSSFTCKLKPVIYMAMVSPAEGNPLNEQLKRFVITKGKNTKLLVQYDTGMR